MKLSSFGIYGYSPDVDDNHHKTASVIATMTWYFIEGFYHRKNEQGFRSNDFYKIYSGDAGRTRIACLLQEPLHRAMVDGGAQTGAATYARNSIVPCSYSDYQAATRGDIPDRYISALSKL